MDASQEIQPKIKKNGLAKTLLILALLILIGAIAYALYSFTSIRQVIDDTATPVVVTPKAGPRIKTRAYPDKLTSDEYESEVAYYLGIEEAKDPREALQELRKNIETDNALLRSCHPITHEIGRKAFEMYKDFDRAMQYLDEVCNTGYMHGVIEAKFSGSADILSEMSTICNDHDEGRCLHGVGHGLMFYTENDLPRSLTMCETYPKGLDQQYCAEGVFMENFNTDQKVHPSKYLSANDFFFPCNDQKPKYKDACFYYAPLHYIAVNENAYTPAMNWCTTADTEFVRSCIRGVAAIAIKQNMTNPKFVESICMTGPEKQIPYCIDGMTGLYLNHYNSLDKAYQMCDSLLDSNKRACTAGVKVRETNFQGEVKGANISL